MSDEKPARVFKVHDGEVSHEHVTIVVLAGTEVVSTDYYPLELAHPIFVDIPKEALKSIDD